jgi:hypothetical protein
MPTPSVDRNEGDDAPIAVLSVNYTKTGKIKKALECITRTGEIITTRGVPSLDLGSKVEKRAAVLRKLRPEVRQFAEFVLKFANKRRGITPGIDTLADWYADLNAKRPDNVRRYIRPLIDAKVLMHDSLLGPAFQRTGGMAHDHLSEHEHAAGLYLWMRHRGFTLSAERRGAPADADLVAAEVARLDAEMEAERAAWFARFPRRTEDSLTSTVPQPA